MGVSMNKARMNQAEFARLLDVTPPAVSAWIKAGKIDLGADGLLDPKEAVAQLAERSNVAKLQARIEAISDGGAPATSGAAPGDADADEATGDRQRFLTARAKREHFAAQSAELDFRLKEGSMVLRADVDRDAFEAARGAQQMLLALPDRLAPLLAAESDPHRVHVMMVAELHRVIDAIVERAAGGEVQP
jgi:hypothetical protein